MKNLYFIFLLSWTNFIFAQNIGEDILINKTVTGYILLENGDTLNGKIKVSNRAKNQVRVKFTNSDGKSTTYKAKKNKLKGYGFETKLGRDATNTKWRHFKLRKVDQPPMIFASSTVFIEIKATGALNLFNFYVETNTQTNSPYKHYYFMEGLGFSFQKISRENFDKITTQLGKNCSKIRRTSGQLSFYDFDRIVTFYNQCQEVLSIKE